MGKGGRGGKGKGTGTPSAAELKKRKAPESATQCTAIVAADDPEGGQAKKAAMPKKVWVCPQCGRDIKAHGLEWGETDKDGHRNPHAGCHECMELDSELYPDMGFQQVLGVKTSGKQEGVEMDQELDEARDVYDDPSKQPRFKPRSNVYVATEQGHEVYHKIGLATHTDVVRLTGAAPEKFGLEVVAMKLEGPNDNNKNLYPISLLGLPPDELYNIYKAKIFTRVAVIHDKLHLAHEDQLIQAQGLRMHAHVHKSFTEKTSPPLKPNGLVKTVAQWQQKLREMEEQAFSGHPNRGAAEEPEMHSSDENEDEQDGKKRRKQRAAPRIEVDGPTQGKAAKKKQAKARDGPLAVTTGTTASASAAFTGRAGDLAPKEPICDTKAGATRSSAGKEKDESLLYLKHHDEELFRIASVHLGTSSGASVKCLTSLTVQKFLSEGKLGQCLNGVAWHREFCGSFNPVRVCINVQGSHFLGHCDHYVTTTCAQAARLLGNLKTAKKHTEADSLSHRIDQCKAAAKVVENDLMYMSYDDVQWCISMLQDAEDDLPLKVWSQWTARSSADSLTDLLTEGEYQDESTEDGLNEAACMEGVTSLVKRLSLRTAEDQALNSLDLLKPSFAAVLQRLFLTIEENQDEIVDLVGQAEDGDVAAATEKTAPTILERVQGDAEAIAGAYVSFFTSTVFMDFLGECLERNRSLCRMVLTRYLVEAEDQKPQDIVTKLKESPVDLSCIVHAVETVHKFLAGLALLLDLKDVPQVGQLPDLTYFSNYKGSSGLEKCMKSLLRKEAFTKAMDEVIRTGATSRTLEPKFRASMSKVETKPRLTTDEIVDLLKDMSVFRSGLRSGSSAGFEDLLFGRIRDMAKEVMEGGVGKDQVTSRFVDALLSGFSAFPDRDGSLDMHKELQSWMQRHVKSLAGMDFADYMHEVSTKREIDFVVLEKKLTDCTAGDLPPRALETFDGF
ncbi:unnamed protein product, partial [Symbiodinium sp. CCMP2456]